MNAHFPKKPSQPTPGPAPRGPLKPWESTTPRVSAQPASDARAEGTAAVKSYDGPQRRHPMPAETTVRFEDHFGSVLVHVQDHAVYSAIREAVIAHGGPDPALDEGTALISVDDLRETLGAQFRQFAEGEEDTFTLDTYAVANMYGYDAADSILRGGIPQTPVPPSRADIGMAWWHLVHEVEQVGRRGGPPKSPEENLKGSIAVLRSAMLPDTNRGGDAIGLLALERLEADLLNPVPAEGRNWDHMKVDLNLVRLPIHAYPRTIDKPPTRTIDMVEAQLGITNEIIEGFRFSGLNNGYYSQFLAKRTVLEREIVALKEGQFAAEWRERTLERQSITLGTPEDSLAYIQRSGMSSGYGFLVLDKAGLLDAHLKLTPRPAIGEEHSWSLRETGKLAKFGKDTQIVYYENIATVGDTLDAIETITNRLSWLKEGMATAGIEMKDALIITKGDASEAASLFEERNIKLPGKA